MTLKVTGLSSVMDQLREVSLEMGHKALVQAARAAFKRVAESAKQLVPVDSGDLREAIALRSLKPKTDAVAVVGIRILSRTNASKQATMAAAAFNEGQSTRLPPSRRWHFIELGTKFKAARPFLRPAMDANAQGVVDDLAVQLRKKIRAAVKRKSRGSNG